MSKYFRLFENCIITKGYSRSIICDLQRDTLSFLPNDIVEVIEMLDGQQVSINNVIDFFGKHNKKLVRELLNYLLQKEYGFVLSKRELSYFPKMDKTFHYPSHINYSVIEFDIHNNYPYFEKIILGLSELNCHYVTIMFYANCEQIIFKDILNFCSNSTLKSIEFIVPYNIDIEYNKLISELNTIPSPLTKLIVTSNPYDIFLEWSEKHFFDVIYTQKKITSFKSCGVVDTRYFNTNLPKVLEAINYNSCLNMKISVDKNGDIRNCPSMLESFGNIKDTTLEEALNKPGFKKYWNITKDQIEVCKDCEFRYICTDCRAYRENPANVYSKPLKCGYNPYTTEWEEWSINPLKQKAIDFYGMREILSN